VNGRVGIHVLRTKKGNGSPYSIAERMVPEMIPVLGSQFQQKKHTNVDLYSSGDAGCRYHHCSDLFVWFVDFKGFTVNRGGSKTAKSLKR